LLHLCADCDLLGGPAKDFILISELEIPRNRGVSDTWNCDSALDDITVGNGVQEICFTMDQGECNFLLEENFIVMEAAREFP